MNRIDWIILRRIGSRIALAVLIIFGLIALIESLDTYRFAFLSEQGGPLLAIAAIAASATRWTIKTLSVTVLIGTTLGMMELQARQELTVIKSSGFSIWRLMRAPVVATVIAAVAIALVAEGVATTVNRTINYASPNYAGMLTPKGEIWLEQQDGAQRYVMMATKMSATNLALNDVTVFLLNDPKADRLRGNEARLRGNEWVFPEAYLFKVDRPTKLVKRYKLQTTSTVNDLALKLRSAEDMTLPELLGALSGRISDPALRAGVTTRVIKLITLPVLLVGSLFIAFAFTAGYRRTNKYGTSVLYAIVLGFVVFVITEMADRAGSSGAIEPIFAAVGPAFVAIVIGLTVLLHKEDGRA